VEIDQGGQVVRELPSDRSIKLRQLLPNGNSLVRVGEDYKSSRIEERDASGKVVWSYTNDTIVITAQRLPSGDTLIGAMGQAKVVDVNSNVTWGQVKAMDDNGNVTWKPDKSLFKYSTGGYEAYRYYPVLVP